MSNSDKPRSVYVSSKRIDPILGPQHVCRNPQAKRPSSATLHNAHLMASMMYTPKGCVKSTNHGASSRKMNIHTKEYRSAPSLTASQGYVDRRTGEWVDAPLSGFGRGGVSTNVPVPKKGRLQPARPDFEAMKSARLSDLKRVRIALGSKLSSVGNHEVWADRNLIELSGFIGSPLWTITRMGARVRISVQLWDRDQVVHSDVFFVGV